MMFDVNCVPAFLAWQTGEPRDDGLTIYAPDQIVERNQTYGVAQYLPGHLMIGDDSGGRGVLLDDSGAVWICDMGAFDEECREPLAAHLAQWVEQGCPLPSSGTVDDE